MFVMCSNVYESSMKSFLNLLFIFSICLNLIAVAQSAGQDYTSAEQDKVYQDDQLKNAKFSKWNGYEMAEFEFDKVDAKIVFPIQPDEQKNWIWRTQFWAHEPQVDTALLAKGFHVVYIDVRGLYGGGIAVARFNRFYEFLIRKFKLHPKAVLEGMSRGGLDAYNWASENTDKVSCIYADAPVCDIKSWPGKDSKEHWDKCLNAYGLTNETVKNFKGIPIYNCKRIAEAKIPVLHVCGDQDTVVPMAENTYKLAEVFRKAGGEMEIIVKKGVGHHPHCLTDPTPIVSFILKNTSNKH